MSAWMSATVRPWRRTETIAPPRIRRIDRTSATLRGGDRNAGTWSPAARAANPS